MQSNIPQLEGKDLNCQGEVKLGPDLSDVDEHHAIRPRWIHASHVSTWYKQAGVEEYLQGVPLDPFLSFIKMPVENEAVTKAAQMIWDAAAGVVRVGEQIIAHTDTFILKDVARIHRDRTLHKPIQVLEDTETLRLWAEPWQRILIFFVRTQALNDWNGLKYHFTAQQQTAWEKLWQAALDHKDGEEVISTFKLNALQLACLQFCVELLNQYYQASAFDCALVCALAALSHDQNCWLLRTSYGDILSKVIRIGQSFIIQQALLLGSDSEDLFEELEHRELERKRTGDWTGEMLCEIPMEDEEPGITRWEWLDSWVQNTTAVGTKTPIDWMMNIVSGDQMA